MPSRATTALSPTQRQLLAAAALASDRMLTRPSAMSAAAYGRSIQGMAVRGFVRPADATAAAHQKASQQPYVLTLVGFALISGEPYSEPTSPHPIPPASNEGPPLTDLSPAEPVISVPRQSRHDQIVALLSRPEGATVPFLMSTMGWLPHTTRAALSNLRKKGYHLDLTRVKGDALVYRITEGQGAP